jgi:hypothetical protein
MGGQSEIAMLRGIVFLALVGGAGFSAWTSFQDSSRDPLDWAMSEVHAMVTQREPEEPLESTPLIVEAQPVAFQADTTVPDDRFTISKETLAAITCGPWDVSEAGIETILQEMVRRGWTPPSGAKALEVSHNLSVEALDPDAPVPAPAEQLHVVSAETQPPSDNSPSEASSF